MTRPRRTLRRIFGRGPSDAAAGRQNPPGRHAASRGSGRRRRGEPLVPGSLVGFFGLIAVIFGFIAGQSWQESRPWEEPTATVDGTVVEIIDSGFAARDAGEVLVRYVVAGTEYEIEVDRDPDYRFLELNDVLPIEYAVTQPSRARAVWAVEGGAADAPFWAVLSGLCVVLGIAFGIGRLVGKRRLNRR